MHSARSFMTTAQAGRTAGHAGVPFFPLCSSPAWALAGAAGAAHQQRQSVAARPQLEFNVFFAPTITKRNFIQFEYYGRPERSSKTVSRKTLRDKSTWENRIETKSERWKKSKKKVLTWVGVAGRPTLQRSGASSAALRRCAGEQASSASSRSDVLSASKRPPLVPATCRKVKNTLFTSSSLGARTIELLGELVDIWSTNSLSLKWSSDDLWRQGTSFIIR